MKKTTLYIGLNDKDTKTQIVETQKAIETIENALIENDIFATITIGNGLYKHENGEKVKETTAIIEILHAVTGWKEKRKLENAVKTVTAKLKTELNQESILKQTQQVKAIFE